MLESPDSPVVVWSRPPSLRSLRSGKKVVPGQYVLDEPDTLCVLPSSMRIVCSLLTILLILSLLAAILNSLQSSSNSSASYCKRPEQAFSPSILLAITCVIASCLLGIFYSISRYFCRNCHLSTTFARPIRL
ncbi:unnamed protein product [Caenorhabditis bovis]|uniref:Uncharacterized protein n=1 Tax=Caenorhabditis bovis TaxID=2654633 RepID=A0A8S1EVD8_9PELO|nr:unnamed protein product [Caenorhabditis bovis]